MSNDEKWMRIAIDEAKLAMDKNEVPVGAVLVKNDKLIAQAHNKPITKNDPTAHAEIVALRKAAQYNKNYRLVNATLYVTLEPCTMCAGAILQARIKRIVFGAYDNKAGAAGSRFDILRDSRHNHHLECVSGILADDCSRCLTNFFKQRRN
jgi:tRNA(adenine34) deaminase